MNLHSPSGASGAGVERRSWLVYALVAATAPLVVLACSGSTTPASPQSDPSNGNGADGPDATAPSQSSSGGGTSSSGGGASSGADGSASSPAPDDASVTPVDGSACSAKGSEIVMIGDSYPALSGEIGKHLQALASAAGALAPGDAYRTYYKSGANMATYPGSTITAIPAQFQQAVTANPDIKYVIMDGGGNDILLENSQCIDAPDAAGSLSATCQTAIQNAIDAANTLFGTMKTDNVEKIIYYFYPHLPTAGKPSVNTVMDYSYPLVQAACAAAPVPCYFVDTRAAFDGHPEYIGPDGIHPTTAGSDVIAGLIWGVMQQECVAL